jgi:hypothetical protein
VQKTGVFSEEEGEGKQDEDFKDQVDEMDVEIVSNSPSPKKKSANTPSESTDIIRVESSGSTAGPEKPASPSKVPPPAEKHSRPLLTINRTKLWPLFIFEAKNKILLDSVLAILFDGLDQEYDQDTKYAMQLAMYKILGRVFGMDKANFLSPIVTNDTEPTHLPKMFESLKQDKQLFHKQLRKFVVHINFGDECDEDFSDLKPFLQSRNAVESMAKNKFFAQHLEFFKNCDKDLIHFYSVESLTKVILQFFCLYQRLSVVWDIFEKVARENIDFDILKQFGNFKDLMVQTLIQGHHYDGMPDAELLFSEVFLELGPLIANIPGMVTRVLFSNNRP